MVPLVMVMMMAMMTMKITMMMVMMTTMVDILFVVDGDDNGVDDEPEGDDDDMKKNVMTIMMRMTIYDSKLKLYPMETNSIFIAKSHEQNKKKRNESSGVSDYHTQT